MLKSAFLAFATAAIDPRSPACVIATDSNLLLAIAGLLVEKHSSFYVLTSEGQVFEIDPETGLASIAGSTIHSYVVYVHACRCGGDFYLLRYDATIERMKDGYILPPSGMTEKHDYAPSSPHIVTYDGKIELFIRSDSGMQSCVYDVEEEKWGKPTSWKGMSHVYSASEESIIGSTIDSRMVMETRGGARKTLMERKTYSARIGVFERDTWLLYDLERTDRHCSHLLLQRYDSNWDESDSVHVYLQSDGFFRLEAAAVGQYIVICKIQCEGCSQYYLFDTRNGEGNLCDVTGCKVRAVRAVRAVFGL